MSAHIAYLYLVLAVNSALSAEISSLICFDIAFPSIIFAIFCLLCGLFHIGILSVRRNVGMGKKSLKLTIRTIGRLIHIKSNTTSLKRTNQTKPLLRTHYSVAVFSMTKAKTFTSKQKMYLSSITTFKEITQWQTKLNLVYLSFTSAHIP